jgi:hypothetical protein
MSMKAIDSADLFAAAGLGVARGSRLESFVAMRQKRAYERRFLPFLKTVVDFDIACEIGLHQLAGAPLTVKHLLLLTLAPQATVLRRLERLCALGVVVRTRSRRDGRVHHLQLAPDPLRLFANNYGTAPVDNVES